MEFHLNPSHICIILTSLLTLFVIDFRITVLSLLFFSVICRCLFFLPFSLLLLSFIVTNHDFLYTFLQK